MTWRSFAWAAGIVSALSAGAASAQEVDALQRVRELHPREAVEPVTPGDVVIGSESRGGQVYEQTPLDADWAYHAGRSYYFHDRATGRWHTAEERGRLDGKPRLVLEDTSYATIDELVATRRFAAPPPAPPGWTLRVVAETDDHFTRVTGDAAGARLYALTQGGDVWFIDPSTGDSERVLSAGDYIDRSFGWGFCTGLYLDPDNRLYIVSNQRDASERGGVIHNRVTIWRTGSVILGEKPVPRPWLTARYPYGINAYNHGVGHIDMGPDGMLYVNSGSRTDSNEPGDNDRFSSDGEVELTSCIWRLDPSSDAPTIEIFADGLRNAYGFCWDSRGRMIATENGPNLDPPEELNIIEQGAHYGFPYRFSNLDASPYPHTPPAPADLTLRDPVVNLGPDAGGSSDAPLATFDPHSCPTGIAYLGDEFPEPYRDSFFVVRFGPQRGDFTAGFDLLHVKLTKDARGRDAAHVNRLIHPIARPVSLTRAGTKFYICEYNNSTGYTPGQPDPRAPGGRILELSFNP